LDRIKAHKEAKTKTKTKWAKLTHVWWQTKFICSALHKTFTFLCTA